MSGIEGRGAKSQECRGSQDIVSSTPQQGHTVSGHVFVSAQTHRAFSLVRGGKDPFLTQQVSRISKAGADVFLCKARVIPQNVLLGPSFGEQIQNEFNRQTRSSNDGLTGQNGRVSNDVVMPVHETNLSLLVELRPVHLIGRGHGVTSQGSYRRHRQRTDQPQAETEITESKYGVTRLECREEKPGKSFLGTRHPTLVP